MSPTVALFVFVFGAIIGSFLNVVIFRYNTGKSIGGRSLCFSCRKTLAWYELVPLVSFVVLKGRCRHCKSKISFQYFFVELLTGIVFTLTVARLLELGYLALSPWLAFLSTLCALVAMSALIVITVYDLRHKIIPDGPAYLFAMISLARIGFSYLLDPVGYPWYVDIVSGALLALFFVGLWYFSSGRWMGLGDGKLVLGMGWFLPFSQNIASILLAFWAGAIIGILLLLLSHVVRKYRKQPLTMRSELPFAPFLIGALFLVFLFDVHLATLVQFFQL